MLNLFQLVDRQTPDSKNIVVEQINGKESYRFAEDGEDLNFKRVLRGKEIKLGTVRRTHQNDLFLICSISEGPNLIFDSIHEINKRDNRIVTKSGEIMNLKDGTIIIIQPTSKNIQINFSLN